MGTNGVTDHSDGLISISDKILHLRKIHIFKGLLVNDLAAIATITRESQVAMDEVVIREGDPGNTMYLVLEGEVAVVKALADGSLTRKEFELARIGAGDYFGEMALFEDAPRSASIKTVENSHFLTLDKHEFYEIVREYPQIALHICKAFCQRIRELHQTINNLENK